MSLIERLAQPRVSRKNQFCTVGRLLDDLLVAHGDAPGGEHAALAGALSTPAWEATILAEELAKEGYTVTVRHIREHRRGHTEAQCAAHTVGVIQR